MINVVQIQGGIDVAEVLYVIDDGHGMTTLGKRTDIFTDGTRSKETGKNFMHENEFNRAVAKYVGEYLTASGIKVVFSAPTDADTPLETRVAIAERMKADGFVSIHANAMTGKFATGKARGIETFVWMSGGAAGKGELLGRAVHKELVKGTTQVDRGVKKGNHLFLIRKTSMATILVECGFMDNLAEAKLLLLDSFRRECAEEIARGICIHEKKTFRGKVTTSVKPTPAVAPPVKKPNINTEKGIGTVVVAAKTLPMRDAASSNGKLVRNLNEGEFYYVYSIKGGWHGLGADSWAYNLNGKSLIYTPHPKELYRVRKTWANVASQAGAFYDLEGAKDKADELLLSVFDESGKSIYVGKKPAAIAVQPPKVEVPKTSILGESEASVYQMTDFLEAKNPSFKDAQEVAQAFLDVGKEYGVRGDIAFAQSIIETGWFKFDGGTAVTPDQHNYCGMGVTSKGMKGNSFASIREGVTAQIQHLFAYGTTKEMPKVTVVDPRFKYVTRGSAPNWEDLSMKWAMNANYGKHILDLYAELLKTEQSQEEIGIEEVLAQFPERAKELARIVIESGISDGSNPGDTIKRVDAIVMFGRLIQMFEKE